VRGVKHFLFGGEDFNRQAQRARAACRTGDNKVDWQMSLAKLVALVAAG
jgi:hypothetical protein